MIIKNGENMKEKATSLKTAVIKTEYKNSIFSEFFCGIMAVLFLSGFCLSLCFLANIKINLIFVFLASFFVVGLVFTACFFKNVFVYLIFLLCLLIWFLVFFIEIKNGIIVIINGLLNSFGERFLRIIPLFDCEKVNAVYAVVFIIFLLSFPALLAVKNNNLLFFTLIVIPVIIAFCGLKLFSGVLMLLILSFVMITVKILSFRRQNCKYKISISSAFKTIIALILLFVLFISCSIADFKVNIMQTIESKITAETDKIRYGESALPQGNFNNLKAFNPSDNNQLEVVMQNPNSYYLRGYTGAVYNGSGWSGLSNNQIYQNADLFYYLNKHGQSPHIQISRAFEAINLKQKNNIIIKNIGASSKFIYTPYELNDSNVFDEASLSESIVSNGFSGKRFYSFTAYESQIGNYEKAVSKLYNSERSKEYLSLEKQYRSFVYKNYLTLDDNTENLLQNHLGEMQKRSYSDVKKTILNYLSENVNYNEKTGFYKSENDFINQFLEETKSGFSVHYATAAALMFRYFGIPSRYVEGYIITPEDVDDVLSNSEVVLTEKNAHAWTEYYFDGIGWIPFEATPKYIDLMGTNNISDFKMSSDTRSPSDNNTINKKNKTEKINAKKQNIHLNYNVIFVIIILLVICLLVVLGSILLKNFFALRKTFKSFNSSNNSYAVMALFEYSVNLLIKKKYIKNAFLCEPEDVFFGNYSYALQIYQKARFSNNEISLSEKRIMIKFKDDTINFISKNENFLNRFINRFIKFLY